MWSHIRVIGPDAGRLEWNETMRIYCSDGYTDFEGTVADDADLDSTFTLVGDDDGQPYRINGWMISDLEVLEG